MRKFMNKAKAAFDDHQSDSSGQQSFASANQAHQEPLPSQDGPANINPPQPSEVLRYRYQHGTNLGSVFVLEKWLTGSMYAEGSSGSAELAAVTGLVKANGVDATREKFENHWRNYCSDEDLDWLVRDAKCKWGRFRFLVPDHGGNGFGSEWAKHGVSVRYCLLSKQ